MILISNKKNNKKNLNYYFLNNYFSNTFGKKNFSKRLTLGNDGNGADLRVFESLERWLLINHFINYYINMFGTFLVLETPYPRQWWQWCGSAGIWGPRGRTRKLSEATRSWWAHPRPRAASWRRSCSCTPAPEQTRKKLYWE